MTESNDSSEYRIDMELVEKVMNDIETAHAERGTPSRYSREDQLVAIMKSLAPINALECIIGNAHSIKEFPNHRFTTSDERTFGIFFDGERILKLFEREAVSINHRDKAGLQRIKKVAGFILDIGDDDTNLPIVYEQRPDLATAWGELHRVHRVPYPLNQVQSAYHMKLFCLMALRYDRQVRDLSVDYALEGVRAIKFLLSKLGSVLKHSA
jgi:hypothetical protein